MAGRVLRGACPIDEVMSTTVSGKAISFSVARREESSKVRASSTAVKRGKLIIIFFFILRERESAYIWHNQFSLHCHCLLQSWSRKLLLPLPFQSGVQQLRRRHL